MAGTDMSDELLKAAHRALERQDALRAMPAEQWARDLAAKWVAEGFSDLSILGYEASYIEPDIAAVVYSNRAALYATNFGASKPLHTDPPNPGLNHPNTPSSGSTDIELPATDERPSVS